MENTNNNTNPFKNSLETCKSKKERESKTKTD